MEQLADPLGRDVEHAYDVRAAAIAPRAVWRPPRPLVRISTVVKPTPPQADGLGNGQCSTLQALRTSASARAAAPEPVRRRRNPELVR